MDFDQIKHFERVAQSVCDQTTVDIAEKMAMRRDALSKLTPIEFYMAQQEAEQRKYDLLEKLFEASSKESEDEWDVTGALAVPGLGTVRIDQSKDTETRPHYSMTLVKYGDADPNFIAIDFPSQYIDFDAGISVGSVALADMMIIQSGGPEGELGVLDPSRVSLDVHQGRIDNLAYTQDSIETLESLCARIGIDIPGPEPVTWRVAS